LLSPINNVYATQVVTYSQVKDEENLKRMQIFI